MPALFVAMVWHARRRVAALRQVEQMADERRASLDRERGFLRDTSHAIRTPITIARGHLELAGTVPRRRRRDRTSRSRCGSWTGCPHCPTGCSHWPGWTPARSSTSGRPTSPRWSARSAGTGPPTPTGSGWSSCRPTGRLRVDPDWLELALDALVENAVHFTASGDTIRLGCTSSPGHTAITVDDSGPGIEPDDLPFVFERFWHRRPEHGPMGSGLGLPMARAVAEAHGGTLLATASPDGGARFVLSHPAHRVIRQRTTTCADLRLARAAP